MARASDSDDGAVVVRPAAPSPRRPEPAGAAGVGAVAGAGAGKVLDKGMHGGPRNPGDTPILESAGATATVPTSTADGTGAARAAQTPSRALPARPKTLRFATTGNNSGDGDATPSSSNGATPGVVRTKGSWARPRSWHTPSFARGLSLRAPTGWSSQSYACVVGGKDRAADAYQKPRSVELAMVPAFILYALLGLAVPLAGWWLYERFIVWSDEATKHVPVLEYGVLPLLYVTCVMFLARALFPIWPPGTDASEIAASRRPRPLSGGCTAALMLWYIGAVAAFGALAGPDPSPRFEPLDTDTELEALLAAGPPSLGVCHDLETWDLTSICDASYIGTVNPLGNATLTTVAEVNEWAETLSQVLLLVFRLLPGVEDDVINTCIDDGLVPALCSILLPNCDAECTPLNPCVATCAAFIESCGVMLPFLPLLREDFARDYVEGAFPEPLVLSQGILDFAMACSDASSGGSYDEEAVLAAGAANAPHCSGPEFESVVPGPCDRTEYERRTTEYQALLALAALPPASEAEWALRRQLLRAGLAVFAWLAAPVLMLLESRRMSDPQRHSAADKRGGDGSAGDPRVYDATSHTGGSRKAWDTSGGAVSGDDGNGAGAAVAVRGFRGDSTSVVVADDRMSVATPTTRVRRVSHTDDLPGDHADAVIMHDDDNDMTFVDAPHSAPSFRHALGMRAALFGSLVLANAVIALSACLAAERAERTGYAVLFGVVALGVWAKLLKDLVTWNDVYEEAVHRYKYGARSFAVLTRSDQANCFRRLRFCKRRIQAAYEVRFSLTGADFGVFSFVSEGSEAVIQLGGLLQTIDTVSNTVVVVTMLLVALSLFGTVILALMDSRPMRVMFDIMLDATFVLWNFAVRDFSSMGVLSALALAVPVVFSSRQLHTVFEFIVFERARGDCVASHMPLGMAASSTTRQRLRGFRTLGDSASESPGQSLGAASFRDLLGLPRSASSKSEGPEPGPRAAGPPPGIIACCALLVAATLAAVPIARIAQVEADCAASAGDLWAGVDSGDKKFLSDGFFSEAHCHWETITALDLRGHDLETIGPEAHLFASAHVIDARDNPRLAHLHHWTATKLEMLEEVLVSPESPVALSLTWRGVNITTEDLPSWLWRDFATLTHLDLSHNAIAELPDELRQLSALVSLNASYNDISALSESMGALLQLRRLDMTSNHLELHTTETSADVRATLTRLTHLYLGDNDYFAYPNGDCPVEGREGCTNAGLPRTIGRSFEELVVAPNCVHILDWNYGAGTGERKITALDPALFDLPLRHIIASANLLSSFPPAIGNIADTLDVVVVSGNVIGYDGVPDEWRQLRRLGLLQFDSNLLAHPETGMAPPQLFDVHNDNTPEIRMRVYCNDIAQLPDTIWAGDIVAMTAAQNPITTLPQLPASIGDSVPVLQYLSLVSTGPWLEVPTVLLEPPLSESTKFIAWKLSDIVDFASFNETLTEHTHLRCDLREKREQYLDDLSFPQERDIEVVWCVNPAGAIDAFVLEAYFFTGPVPLCLSQVGNTPNAE